MSSNSRNGMKLVIVGGVAGGASAATRARRLSEQAEIVVIERGEFVSFANCGLPYHIGGVIAERDKLLMQTPASLRRRFNLDVRVRTEATAIDPAGHVVTVRDVPSGRTAQERYDKLILATGGAPIRPPLPGIDHPAVFTLRTIPDADRISAAVARAVQPGSGAPGRALVVGAGYIGLEMAESLHRRGLLVTVVEKLDQVIPVFDREMANQMAAHLLANGVELILGDGLAGFADTPDGRLRTTLQSGRTVDADLAILAIGVRPDVGLARSAGLRIGQTGGIAVNEHMQTSNPDIYAVGDAVEVGDTVTGQPTLAPLAGPANRQGRIAADHIFGAQPDRYQSTQGSCIVSAFGLVAAGTGASEKTLRRAGIPFRKVHLHPMQHAGYYPGAAPMHMKLLFAPADGRLLGAQIVGSGGVDKRIDVLALAIRGGLTVFDLEAFEAAYNPESNSAKDPVNMAGFVAANTLTGLSEQVHFDELPPDAFLLDVRTAEEFAAGRRRQYPDRRAAPAARGAAPGPQGLHLLRGRGPGVHRRADPQAERHERRQHQRRIQDVAGHSCPGPDGALPRADPRGTCHARRPARAAGRPPSARSAG